MRFEGALPPLDSALLVLWDRPEKLVLEVHSHTDPATGFPVFKEDPR